ncbi:hypothetical protein U1Q18_025617 [Sarracenia purpurea var. burkii]
MSEGPPRPVIVSVDACPPKAVSPLLASSMESAVEEVSHQGKMEENQRIAAACGSTYCLSQAVGDHFGYESTDTIGNEVKMAKSDCESEGLSGIRDSAEEEDCEPVGSGVYDDEEDFSDGDENSDDFDGITGIGPYPNDRLSLDYQQLSDEGCWWVLSRGRNGMW